VGEMESEEGSERHLANQQKDHAESAQNDDVKERFLNLVVENLLLVHIRTIKLEIP